jgi:hypothetical protein
MSTHGFLKQETLLFDLAKNIMTKNILKNNPSNKTILALI